MTTLFSGVCLVFGVFVGGWCCCFARFWWGLGVARGFVWGVLVLFFFLWLGFVWCLFVMSVCWLLLFYVVVGVWGFGWGFWVGVWWVCVGFSWGYFSEVCFCLGWVVCSGLVVLVFFSVFWVLVLCRMFVLAVLGLLCLFVGFVCLCWRMLIAGFAWVGFFVGWCLFVTALGFVLFILGLGVLFCSGWGLWCLLRFVC